MKLLFVTVQSKKEPWVEAAKAVFHKKISGFFPFAIEEVKSPEFARGQEELKVRQSDEYILKKITPRDLVVLFDEAGRGFGDSFEFSKKINALLESGKPQIVFVVGGAFGVGELLRQRADLTCSLSPLTMSHHVASAMALEQIYRSLTIIKNLPYHNEGAVGSRKPR